MLEECNVEPHQLAYDRPSQKFRNFLAKYYGLSKYVPQNNNFVVFDDYFQQPTVGLEAERSSRTNEHYLRTTRRHMVDQQQPGAPARGAELSGGHQPSHRSCRSMATSVDKIKVGGSRAHDALRIPDAMNATNQSNVFTSLGQELLNRRADKSMNANSLA